ncbi:hypothetical protein [Stomatohabitans albus]|uniref:hypothetical protein n=1 Tax=Stomatohabitans albus TaxID=3110766 RepID=UPI00300D7635
MSTFATRFTAVAFAALATLAPLATPAHADEFKVAGAPGLAHIVDASGEARCEATVVAPKAVLTSAECITENGTILAASDIHVVEGSTSTPASIIWVHPDAPVTDLALVTLATELDTEPVALDTFSLNVKHPDLAENVEWVKGILDALEAEETETRLAEPAAQAPVAPIAPVVPAATHPVRHFTRVER